MTIDKLSTWRTDVYAQFKLGLSRVIFEDILSIIALMVSNIPIQVIEESADTIINGLLDLKGKTIRFKYSAILSHNQTDYETKICFNIVLM